MKKKFHSEAKTQRLRDMDTIEFASYGAGKRCQDHPRYQGKLRPKTLCPWCWFIYVDKLQVDNSKRRDDS